MANALEAFQILASPCAFSRLRENGSGARRGASWLPIILILETVSTPGLLQRRELQSGLLVVGGDAGMAVFHVGT